VVLLVHVFDLDGLEANKVRAIVVVIVW